MTLGYLTSFFWTSTQEPASKVSDISVTNRVDGFNIVKTDPLVLKTRQLEQSLKTARQPENPFINRKKIKASLSIPSPSIAARVPNPLRTHRNARNRDNVNARIHGLRSNLKPSEPKHHVSEKRIKYNRKCDADILRDNYHEDPNLCTEPGKLKAHYYSQSAYNEPIAESDYSDFDEEPTSSPLNSYELKKLELNNLKARLKIHGDENDERDPQAAIDRIKNSFKSNFKSYAETVKISNWNK